MVALSEATAVIESSTGAITGFGASTSRRSARWATAWTTSSRRSAECRMTADKQAPEQSEQ